MKNTFYVVMQDWDYKTAVVQAHFPAAAIMEAEVERLDNGCWSSHMVSAPLDITTTWRTMCSR